MISLRGVSYSYPGGERALDAVSLEAPAGGLLVLAGANGSGKSTLLGILAGLFAPDSGEAEVRGRVRLMVQQSDLEILGATVGEDLMLGRERQGAQVREQARDTAARLGLDGMWETPVSALSFGQRRKLCLASALLDNPDVLLLDEPFSGLDYLAVREMRGHLAANREQGLAQVAATHDLEPFLDLADAAAVLDGGRLAAFGPLEEVLESVENHGVRAPCAWRMRRGLPPWEGTP